jgi:hypothetical protein
MSQFVHLHVHSQYSLLDGQASIPRLVDKALADNQPGKGGSEPVYNDVVAAVSDNFIKMQEGVTLAADEEHTVTFNVSVPKFPGVAFKPADYKVVVFAHSDANGGMVDNANMCAFGSSVGYALN